MDSEILCQFLLWNNEGIFERPRKNSLDGTGESKFLDLVLTHFWACLKIFQKSEKLWIMIGILCCF